MTCLLERTALLLFPLLFLLVVTVRCLCVIVVFVWVISHSDLRSGQRALMHMGKIIPLRTNGSSPSYSSASSPLLLSCSFVSQWRNETSTTSTSLPLLLVSVQALFPLVIFWAPCTFPRNLCIHFLCCCAGWTSSVWEQLKSSRFFMFKSPSNKGLGFLRAAGQTFPFTWFTLLVTALPPSCLVNSDRGSYWSYLVTDRFVEKNRSCLGQISENFLFTCF